MTSTRAIAVLLGVLFGIVAPARAGSLPNFSGTWELDRNRSALPASPPWSLVDELTLFITHEGETLRIERRAKVFGIRQTITSIYYTDGREASNRTPRGETVVSRSHWQGDTLVTVHKSTSGRGDGNDVKRLSDEGRVLVVDAVGRRPGQETTEHSHAVFVKK